ncbi:PAS domain-containing protein, partial [Acinetobacter baumannii]
FLWQMDAQGRFVLGSDEFIRLMGTHTAAGFGRPWQEIAAQYALDPDGRIAAALATKDTWAGITVNGPADGGERLPVELAGLPIYDRDRNFAG